MKSDRLFNHSRFHKMIENHNGSKYICYTTSSMADPVRKHYSLHSTRYVYSLQDFAQMIMYEFTIKLYPVAEPSS